MREIERQQKEQDEARQSNTPLYEIDGLRGGRLNSSSGRLSASNSYHSSRRSSEDSLEETSSIGHIRHILVSEMSSSSSDSSDEDTKSGSDDEDPSSTEEEDSSSVDSNSPKIIVNNSVDNTSAVTNGFVNGVDDDDDGDSQDKDEEFPDGDNPPPMNGLINELIDGCSQSELREAEDKFRKAMIGNAQLDNEKTAAAYQVELYKDRLEELGEEYAQLQEQGLVIVGGDGSSSDVSSEDEADDKPNKRRGGKRALVSAEGADLLATVSGSLDVRLKKLAAERNELSDELRHVKLELEEERNRGRGIGANPADLEDIQSLRSEQAVARLEGQVTRYKTAAEAAEKVEDELKLERRKLQREVFERMPGKSRGTGDSKHSPSEKARQTEDCQVSVTKRLVAKRFSSLNIVGFSVLSDACWTGSSRGGYLGESNHLARR
ncbi:unnamed protein product [Nezara viridula]|uniref:Uncharacterized protein n=1 Tax=Nezara viridula TaxID=85310 RepID=A0A9P0EDQ8_NEZVI|nr:unnamed protein product [Nezara viridula]